MKKSLLLFVAAYALLIRANPVSAGVIEDINALDFLESSRTAIIHLISDHSNAKELIIYAEVVHNERIKKQEDENSVIIPPDFEVMNDCQVASLNNDRTLQILCRIDFTGRGRPTELIAISKQGSELAYTTLAAGEGEFGIGPISDLLKDINNDGKKEIVVEERRFRGLTGEMYSGTEPAPTVINIYDFRDGKFVLANSQHKSYFSNTVLPALQQHLSDLQSGTFAGTEPDTLADHQKDIDATKESIKLAKRAIMFGHY